MSHIGLAALKLREDYSIINCLFCVASGSLESADLYEPALVAH